MRAKIYYMPERRLLDLLRLSVGPLPCLITIPAIEEIPKDASLRHVFYSPERRAIGMVICHPSFEDTPQGRELPNASNLTLIEHVVGLVEPSKVKGMQFSI